MPLLLGLLLLGLLLLLLFLWLSLCREVSQLSFSLRRRLPPAFVLVLRVSWH